MHPTFNIYRVIRALKRILPIASSGDSFVRIALVHLLLSYFYNCLYTFHWILTSAYPMDHFFQVYRSITMTQFIFISFLKLVFMCSDFATI